MLLEHEPYVVVANCNNRRYPDVQEACLLCAVLHSLTTTSGFPGHPSTPHRMDF